MNGTICHIPTHNVNYSTHHGITLSVGRPAADPQWTLHVQTALRRGDRVASTCMRTSKRMIDSKSLHIMVCARRKRELRPTEGCNGFICDACAANIFGTVPLRSSIMPLASHTYPSETRPAITACEHDPGALALLLGEVRCDMVL